MGKGELSAQFLAGRFAAKEAVAKALGPPFGWLEVAILSEAGGRPMVGLSGRAALAAEGLEVLVSISHSEHYASAFAIAQTREVG